MNDPASFLPAMLTIWLLAVEAAAAFSSGAAISDVALAAADLLPELAAAVF
jgi:hypothetical protein